jgi:hypothetical protein
MENSPGGCFPACGPNELAPWRDVSHSGPVQGSHVRNQQRLWVRNYSFVGWLFKHCPLACRPALDAAIVNYPELSQCLRVKHGPLLIRAASVPVSSVLTEKGEDATGVICKLADELAKPDGLFDGVSQIGSFELRAPLSAESLQFFRIIEATDGDELRYRLEMQQA